MAPDTQAGGRYVPLELGADNAYRAGMLAEHVRLRLAATPAAPKFDVLTGIRRRSARVRTAATASTDQQRPNSAGDVPHAG